MKTFLKVLAAILVVVIVLMVGLNLYFTDERLKRTIMPYINNAAGREVHVETMSLALFSTFPHPGLSIRKLQIPGGNTDSGTAADTLLSVEEFVVGIKLFPLLKDEISISEIMMRNPRFTYRVYEDSTTNIDFLTKAEEEEVPADETEGFSVIVPYFTITGGRFGYEDQSSHTSVTLSGVNGNISLRYADLITSTIDIEVEGLSAQSGGTSYVTELPVSLSETSTIDLENETVNLESGTLSIRGLALNLTGTVGKWSAADPVVNLRFTSSSDNFGELLRLAPAEYEDRLAGLETSGSLSINGAVSGAIGGESLPSFNAEITVSDGYLKNPDLPQAVQDIQIRLEAANESVTLETFEATAGSNFLSASGQLDRPLEKDGPFSLTLKGDVDLSTVDSFYSFAEFDIERLGGKLNINATAAGRLDSLETATFDGELKLADGLVKYAEVSEPIENINIDAAGNQTQVTVNSLSLNTDQNRLSVQGSIREPLNSENRNLDLTADLFFDLATLKNFYPINEDTLRLRGHFTANAVLKGKAEQIEQAVQNGSLTLVNGFIDYRKFRKPIEDITLKSTLKGNRLTISTALFRSGQNDLDVSGTVTDYLDDNPELELRLKGDAQFAEIQNYYDLQPVITSLTGTGLLDLTVKGPAQNPELMAFSGTLNVNNLNMDGDSLMLPVTDLNGVLKLTPNSMELTGLRFNYGSSDLHLGGKLTDYMEYLRSKEVRKTTPRLTGRFESNLFNLDELIDWEDFASTQPIPIELPELNSSGTAEIETLIVTGVTMRNLNAEAVTTPDQIELTQASIELLDGTASGSFTWDVPQPDRTNLRFDGILDGINTSSFFREFEVLGPKSKFHEHVTGLFNASVEYYSAIDVYLNPLIPTTLMNGTFTMTKARIQGHPLQNRLAVLLKADELRDIVLDESQTRFSIKNSVLTIENLRLTSGDIGAEMSGTQHLIGGDINYEMNVYLPGRYGDRVASIISAQAVGALTRDNGTILLPLRVTGTQDDPKISPNQDVIQSIIRDMLKKKAGDAIKDLFGGDG